MKIERKPAGNVTILAFTGEFDAFNLPAIREKLDSLIQSGHTHLVFNLRLLKFINSSALGFLITTSKRLRELDGELVLSEPNKFFQSTVNTLGIDQIFKIFATDSDAVSYFRDPGVKTRRSFGGVPVDERLLGSTAMRFRLLDKPGTMAVGKILSIYEDGPAFKYPSDPDEVKIDPDELAIGRGLWIAFAIPTPEKRVSVEMDVEIVMAVALEEEGSRVARYRVRDTRVGTEHRQTLRDFVRRWRDHDDDDPGMGGVPARLQPKRPSGSGAAPHRQEIDE